MGDRRALLATTKGFDPDTGRLPIWASTDNVDRHEEIVEADAFTDSLKVYRTNPVILAGHVHAYLNGDVPVIGKAHNPEVVDGDGKAADGKRHRGLSMEIEFAPGDVSPLGPFYKRAYELKFMNAFSIGFISLETEHDDGEPLRHTKVDLLEVSAVAVGSNRESLQSAIEGGGRTGILAGALVRSIAKGYGEGEIDRDAAKHTAMIDALAVEVAAFSDEIRAWLASDEPADADTAAAASARAILEGKAKPGGIYDDLPVRGADQDDEPDPDIKNVVPFKSFRRLEDDTAWRWNSSVANAVLADANWARYKTAHTFWSPEADEDNPGTPEVRRAYKLPHHLMEGGSLVTVFRGVAAAMGALLGARGGVDVPDDERRGIYNHLAKHYREFDKEPPEFRSDWTLDSLVRFHAEQGVDLLQVLAAWDDEIREPQPERPITLVLDVEPIDRLEEAIADLADLAASSARLTATMDATIDRLERVEARLAGAMNEPPAGAGDDEGARGSREAFDEILDELDGIKTGTARAASRNGGS